jgi:CubicO group peptidase (beta-lactamase class C family)
MGRQNLIAHLPDFALSDPWITREVTLRDMFCHRSGLPDHAGDLLEDIGYGRDEILRRLRYVKPGGAFRAHYAYTNFCFTAAAVAAAKAAGKSWADVSAESLYRPLGMTRTSSRYADFAARENRAYGHVRRDGAWVESLQRQPDAESPAGGASSSARDMAAWLRLQLSGGRIGGQSVVQDFALDETHRPQIATGPADPENAAPTFYGLGWNIGYNEHPLVHWSHSGAFALGAATCVNILPSRKLGIVVLSNSSPVGAPEAICRSFLDLVTAGKIERDWLALYGAAFVKMSEPPYGRDADYTRPSPDATPPAAVSDYVGSYENELYGPIRITNDGRALAAVIGPENMAYDLRHFTGDVFTFQPPGENAYGPSPVRFTRNEKGNVASLKIDYFDGDGQGVFIRPI